MQRKRLLFLLSAVIALVAVAAFAVLWIGARTQLARGVVAGWISEAAGLPATVEELRIGFLPRPSVDMGGIAIAQPPGFSGKPLLEIGRLRLSLPWRSVFGTTRLEAVEISEATARLVVRADGESNWSKLFAEPVPATATLEEASPEWFIGSFDLERGAIDYRDESAHSSWRLAAITVEASDLAPEKDFPLELRLGGIFGPNTINYAMKGTGKLDLEAGRIDGNSLDFRGVADHYTQATLFWNSQTDVEKQHIINAFRFELSTCADARDPRANGIRLDERRCGACQGSCRGARHCARCRRRCRRSLHTRRHAGSLCVAGAVAVRATGRRQHPGPADRYSGRRRVRWRAA